MKSSNKMLVFACKSTNLYDLSCYQNQNVLPKHTKNLVQKQRKIPKRNQRNLLDKSVSARSWNVNPTKL